jgi:hypothetical protein
LLAAASPGRPLPVEFGRPGDARAEVEQAAGPGGGEGDEAASGFVGYEGWRGVCPWRGEALPAGVRPPFQRGRPGRRRWQEARAVTARNACASMDKVACRYQAPYLRTW